MNLISRLLLFLSIIVSILCIYIGIFPIYFTSINDALAYSSNIFSYLAMLFSAFALLIACLAFKVSIIRPKLELAIWAWMGDQNKLTLFTDSDTKIVPMTRPNTSLHFRLENHGKASAKYPVVEVIFRNGFFSDTDFPGWQAVYHENAYGWYGFRWSPKEGTIIYPDLPELLPPMYFSGKQIDKSLALEITIVADGFNKKRYTVPIDVKYNNY